MAAGRPRATQQILELAFYHVGGRQPDAGVGDQHFLRTFGGRRSAGLGREYLLPIPVKRIQETPAFLSRRKFGSEPTPAPGDEKKPAWSNSPTLLDHAGLLSDGPPGSAGLPLFSSSGSFLSTIFQSRFEAYKVISLYSSEQRKQGECGLASPVKVRVGAGTKQKFFSFFS